MNGSLLTIIIFSPLAAGLIALGVRRSWSGWVASGGAFFTFVLAMWGFMVFPREETPSLRDEWQQPGGLLERTVERSLADTFGTDEADVEVERRFLIELRKGALGETERQRLADDLAGVAVLRSHVGALEAMPGVDPRRLADAREELASAERESALLAQVLGRIEGELAGVRRAARGSAGERFKLVEHRTWVPGLHVQYFLAVDGLALTLVLLTALIGLLCVGYTVATGADQAPRQCAVLLLTECGLLGVLCSLDLVLFAVFWILVLVPGYALFRGEGDSAGAQAGARFVLPAFAGALVMLVAFLALYLESGAMDEVRTFNVLALTEHARQGGYAPRFQYLVFACLFGGCVVRLPLVPFHGWLTSAQDHLPPGFSGFLQGAFLNAGAYGLIRLAWPLCPRVVTDPGVAAVLGVLAALAILYAALTALAQRDLQRVIAFAAVGHAGYVLLGLCALTSASTGGAALELVAYGLGACGACLAAGILAARTTERDMGVLGGLIQPLPRLAAVTALFLLTLASFPGLAGFTSRLLVFLGAWSSEVLPRWVSGLALIGLVLGSVAPLWAFNRIYLGELIRSDLGRLRDLTSGEGMALVPLAVLCLLVGLAPSVVLDVLGPAMQGFLLQLPVS